MQFFLLLLLSSHSSNTHVQSARTHFDVHEGSTGVKKTSASGDANVKVSSGTRATFHSIRAMKTLRMAAALPTGGPSSVKSQLMDHYAPDKVLSNMDAAQIEGMIDESIAEHERSFKKLDKAGKGKIPISEIMEYIGSLDLGHTSTTELQEQTMGELNHLDEDNDGALNLDEFLLFMVLATVDLLTEDDLEDLFEMVDADNNGGVSPAEMTALLQMGGGFKSTQQVNDIFTRYDVDKDGHLNRDEFVKFAHDFHK